ncbi:DUF3426 domain-containing protein [Chitinilyticum piscinae]|uniref:DUF3426 domain-containing protein n=1 Tax=Chitinilyticum piscinae TaxID=2866724 RepID=UPI0027E427C6|nr:DUF3426 domain-containing protein [Chitinilyticum piscinae]
MASAAAQKKTARHHTTETQWRHSEFVPPPAHKPRRGSRRASLPDVAAQATTGVDSIPAISFAQADGASSLPSGTDFNPIRLPEDEALFAPAADRRGEWKWSLLSGLMLAVLLAQGAFLFRQSLSMRYPVLRPYFVELCRQFECIMPLPREAEQLKLEFSELNFVPGHSNLIQMTATLRNLAQYEQDLPLLELTLTDDNKRVIAKRVFKPAEYLAPGEKQRTSLLPADELHAFLQLDQGEAQATDFSLFWFYN